MLPRIPFPRIIIFKACVGRIDPKKDLLEKEIFLHGSWWAGIHDGKNITREIAINALAIEDTLLIIN